MSPEYLRALQNRVDWSMRDAMAGALAELARAAGAPALPAPDAALAGELARAGICKAPVGLSRERCSEAVEYFSATRCYAGHVPAASDGVPKLPTDAAKASTYGSYRLQESMAAPHLLECALHPQVLGLAGAYLGCAPLLYSINTFWTFPGEKPGLTHGFHRDEDDYRFLAVFLYLTDVEPGEGELYFIEGTHNVQTVSIRIRPRWLKRVLPFQKPDVASDAEEFRRLSNGNGYGHDAFYERRFSGYVRCVAGPAGAAFMADTFGLHRGTPPRSRPRLVTWFRYGLYENVAYRHDRTERVPASLVRGRIDDDPAIRHVSRLVLDWER